MHHAIGLCPKERFPPRPLDHGTIIRFDTNSPHASGYFELLASHFNKFAQRDSFADITFINVSFSLNASDLNESLEILDSLEKETALRPKQWREYLGEVQHPGMKPKPINPLLFRSRMLSIISKLRELIQIALSENKLLVYGNAVFYRALLGIKLPAGAEQYS